MSSEPEDARIFNETLEALQQFGEYSQRSMDTSSSSCLDPVLNQPGLYHLDIAKNKAVTYRPGITPKQVLSYKARKRKTSELNEDTHETLPMGTGTAVLNKKPEKEKCYIRRRPNDPIRQD